MIIKLNRQVRQLCVLLTRPGSLTPAVTCRPNASPCCATTGNKVVLTIARRGCPDTFWMPTKRTGCEEEVVSECGCMQELVGHGYVPAIELICPPRTDGCQPRPVIIEYGVASCAPNGAICFRLDDLLMKQRDGRYHAIITNGVDCMWTGQIALTDGAMRLKEYSTQGVDRATC